VKIKIPKFLIKIVASVFEGEALVEPRQKLLIVQKRYLFHTFDTLTNKMLTD